MLDKHSTTELHPQSKSFILQETMRWSNAKNPSEGNPANLSDCSYRIHFLFLDFHQQAFLSPSYGKMQPIHQRTVLEGEIKCLQRALHRSTFCQQHIDDKWPWGWQGHRWKEPWSIHNFIHQKHPPWHTTQIIAFRGYLGPIWKWDRGLKEAVWLIVLLE